MTCRLATTCYVPVRRVRERDSQHPVSPPKIHRRSPPIHPSLPSHRARGGDRPLKRVTHTLLLPFTLARAVVGSGLSPSLSRLAGSGEAGRRFHSESCIARAQTDGTRRARTRGGQLDLLGGGRVRVFSLCSTNTTDAT